MSKHTGPKVLMRRQPAGADPDGAASTVATDHNPDAFLGRQPCYIVYGGGHIVGSVVKAVLVGQHVQQHQV